jgi:hypothetical protein
MPDTATAPPDNSNAQADWEATAQQPEAQAPAPAPVETQNAPQSTQTLPETQTPGYNVPEAADRPADAPSLQPVVITPLKRGGLLGVMDSVADSLTGKTRPEIGTDQDGNAYVKSTSLSRGEQWERIAGTAIAGAAKGMAAGRGRGNLGAAAAAGVDEGQKIQQGQQQQQKDMSEEARQENLEKANHQMLVMKQAEHAFNQTRLGVEATQQDIKFAQQQSDYYEAHGGKLLGVMSSHGDGQLAAILKENPNVMKEMVQNGTIKTPQHFDENGKPAGIEVWQMPTDFSKEQLPAGTTFHTWDPVKNEIVEHTATDPMTQGQRDAYEMAAANAAMKFRNDKTEQDLKTAQTTKANADAEEAAAKAKNAPLEANELRARAAQQWAAAGKDKATADNIRTGVATADGQPNPRFEALSQALYDGDILPADLKRESAKSGIDPNEIMGRAIEIGKATGRPYSAPIVEQEHKFAAAPKTQAALDGIDRIIGKPGDTTNGYLNQMLSLAEKAELGTNGAFNSAALAVKRFAGDTDAKNFQTAVSETRRSIAGLIGNPVLGGSDSDKKLKQADEMLGKSPTLANLRGAAGVLKTALETQRQSMIQNNRFLQKRYGGGTQQPQAGAQPQQANPAATGAITLNPGEVPAVNHETGQQIVLRNNKYVDVKTGKAVQ